MSIGAEGKMRVSSVATSVEWRTSSFRLRYSNLADVVLAMSILAPLRRYFVLAAARGATDKLRARATRRGALLPLVSYEDSAQLCVYSAPEL